MNLVAPAFMSLYEDYQVSCYSVRPWNPACCMLVPEVLVGGLGACAGSALTSLPVKIGSGIMGILEFVKML